MRSANRSHRAGVLLLALLLPLVLVIGSSAAGRGRSSQATAADGVTLSVVCAGERGAELTVTVENLSGEPLEIVGDITVRVRFGALFVERPGSSSLRVARVGEVMTFTIPASGVIPPGDQASFVSTVTDEQISGNPRMSFNQASMAHVTVPLGGGDPLTGATTLDGCSEPVPDGDTLAGGIVATFDVNGETFRVWVTNPDTIAQIFALHAGDSLANIPAGPVGYGPGQAGHNLPWSWHLDPELVEMAEMTIELCDAMPSYVEENVTEFVEVVGAYCPWSAQLVSIEDYR